LLPSDLLYSEQGGRKFLQNFGKVVQYYMASELRNWW